MNGNWAEKGRGRRVRLKEVWEEVGRRVFFAAEVQKRL